MAVSLVYIRSSRTVRKTPTQRKINNNKKRQDCQVVVVYALGRLELNPL